MFGAVTEEDVIKHAQHLDLIYSQSGTLYDIIPNAPRPSNDLPQTAPGPHAEGVIGFVSATSVRQVAGQLDQLALTDKPAASTLATTSSDPAPISSITTCELTNGTLAATSNRTLGEQ